MKVINRLSFSGLNKVLEFYRKEAFLKNQSFFNKIKNYYENQKELRKIENIFDDFTEVDFPSQAKLIYDEVIEALETRNYPDLMRSLVADINYEDVIVYKNYSKIEQLKDKFHSNNSNWKIIQAKLFNLPKENSKVSEELAQVMMKFTNKNDNQNHFVLYERFSNEKNSIFKWKILLLNDNKI